MDGQALETPPQWEHDIENGDGRVVLGRRGIDEDEEYTSCEIDELIFYNRQLSDLEI